MSVTGIRELQEMFVRLILTVLLLFQLTFVVVLDMSLQCRVEQRTVIKFMVAQGATPIACWRQLDRVFGEHALGKTQTRYWHKKFKAGDIDSVTKDAPRSGRVCSGRSAENIQKVETQLETNRRQSVRELSLETGVPRATVQRVLRKDLKLHHVSPKFVPWILTDEQKRFCKEVCEQHLQSFQEQGLDFLRRIITGDESSLPTFDPETKIWSTQWIPRGATRPKKALHSRTRRSTMITVFFDCNGLLHHEFVPVGETIRAEDYCQTLGRLREQIRRKRPHLWRMENGWRHYLLHHDNATPHTANPTLAAIGETNTELLAHPPYSPDLAPCDFFLFPLLKAQMRGNHYRNIEQVQHATVEILRAIPADKFEDAIKELPVRWAKCVKAEGDFFKGDGLEVPDFMVEISDSDADSSSESE